MLQQVMAYDSQSLPRSKHILVGVDKTGLWRRILRLRHPRGELDDTRRPRRVRASVSRSAARAWPRETHKTTRRLECLPRTSSVPAHSIRQHHT